MAERRRRADDRTARRDSLLVLLSRIQRGVPITPAEAALLRAHVELEITESEELRRTAGGQQAAIQHAGRRLAAAETALREAEQRAEAAEEHAAEQHARALGWRQHAIEAAALADRHLAAWRSARRRAHEHAAEEQRVRGWCAHWHDRTNRYRAAWRSARARARTRTEERDAVRALADARGQALATRQH
jgi:hypothetical protein